jgi:hypothetical protein
VKPLSTNAPGLTKLRDYANERLGPSHFLGIVGDAAHNSGYHLGPDRIHDKAHDYSLRLDRDVAGGTRFPTFACAYDMGMGWSQSRQWLAWLVNQCRQDAFPQIREVIGSLDGTRKQYWSGLRGYRTETYDGDNHVDHTHISVYRDTAETDHSAILRGYFEGVAAQVSQSAPAFPGRPLRFTPGQSMMTGPDVRTWQARMRQRGWRIEVDGDYGPGSAGVATRFQKDKGLAVDGIVGPRTWAAAWTAPIT